MKLKKMLQNFIFYMGRAAPTQPIPDGNEFSFKHKRYVIWTLVQPHLTHAVCILHHAYVKQRHTRHIHTASHLTHSTDALQPSQNSSYRVAKTHRMLGLCMLFSAKEPYKQWPICEKRPPRYGILWVCATLWSCVKRHRRRQEVDKDKK